jgi:thiamine biosynthesis lipoprotein
MDTVMTLTIYSVRGADRAQAADEVVALVEQLAEDILDKNATTADEEEMMRWATEAYNLTDGMFDVTLAPVIRAWGFGTGEYRVPAADELQALLASRNKDDIDYGGIAKGYASDLASSRVLGGQSGNSSIADFGGNVCAVGSRPDGKPWRVAVRDPLNTESTCGTLELTNCAAVTSGGYQRNFTQDGVTYHHIIDPRTGYPAQSGLASVTVVCETGALADGLSTGLFVLGKERALEIWRENRDKFDLVLIEENGALTVTDGLSFTSDRAFEVAS